MEPRTMDPAALLAALTNCGAELLPGLSDAELDQVQERFGFAFAPDHRLMLSLALPVGRGWPDWRHGDSDSLQLRVDSPVDGILYDVENNDYWCQDWGRPPADIGASVRAAREHLALIPKVAPLFVHRRVPTVPSEPGNPVLSCHQTDVIYYGTDLLDWFYCEFHSPRPADTPGHVDRHLPFWKELVEGWTDPEGRSRLRALADSKDFRSPPGGNSVS